MESMKIILSTYCVLTLPGCGNAEPEKVPASSSHQVELQAFVDGIKTDLVFVEGGEFLMGDFGQQYGSEGLPFDRESHSKPLHKVLLPGFSMSKFKVTNAEFKTYLTFNQLELRSRGIIQKKEWGSINSASRTPAHVDWYEAEKYCDWLAQITKLPFALPTEAQWEYAARSRGQFLMVATDDGTYKAEPWSKRTDTYLPRGINISTTGDRVSFADEMGWDTEFYTPLPVDMFPSNDLGIYSMSDNGYEWVQDWYDPDYYSRSPILEPKGPEHPVFKDYLGHYTKVLRGQSYANPYWGGGVNVFRTPGDPLGQVSGDGAVDVSSYTMRCVVNSSTPVKLSVPTT
jgi:formylglycine-generating enzyme required for sulfatase activity